MIINCMDIAVKLMCYCYLSNLIDYQNKSANWYCGRHSNSKTRNKVA